MDLLKDLFRARGYMDVAESGPRLTSSEATAILTDNVSKKSLTGILDDIGDAGTIIIVSTLNKLPATLTRRALTHEYNIEFFTESELRLQAIFHHNMPVYTMMDGADISVLQQRYLIDIQNLPILASTDPVARYFGFPLGTVLRIEKNGRVWYRIVKVLTQ